MLYYENLNVFLDIETWTVYPAEFNGVTQIPVLEEGREWTSLLEEVGL